MDIHRVTNAVSAQPGLLAESNNNLLFVATRNFPQAVDSAFVSRCGLGRVLIDFDPKANAGKGDCGSAMSLRMARASQPRSATVSRAGSRPSRRAGTAALSEA